MTPAGLPRQENPLAERSISETFYGKHEQYAIGHYQPEWAFRG
jgi:hypothetical protein